MITQIELSRLAKKQIKKIPEFILNKLESWIRAVELEGLEVIKKIPGYHDEALKGNRKGQRSIRLNRAYRAIYKVLSDGSIEFIRIEEVTKHDY